MLACKKSLINMRTVWYNVNAKRIKVRKEKCEFEKVPDFLSVLASPPSQMVMTVWGLSYFEPFLLPDNNTITV